VFGPTRCEAPLSAIHVGSAVAQFVDGAPEQGLLTGYSDGQGKGLDDERDE